MIEGELKQFGVPAKLPIIPGHEVTGEVAEVGALAKGMQAGDRVGSAGALEYGWNLRVLPRRPREPLP